MDRDDLLSAEGRRFVEDLSGLAEILESRRLPVTSWYGGLARPPVEFSLSGLRTLVRRILGRTRRAGSVAERNRGGASYRKVPGIARDDRHPWFLYWEAFWVSEHGPRLAPDDTILDAGGTASLFSCHLARQGARVHSVDLNDKLVSAGNEIAAAMGWNMRSHCMDMTDLRFDSEFFDHAYSICVFEHLDFEQRQKALREIARVLKPGGTLSLTFDYRGPGVQLSGRGPDHTPANLIRSPEDVERNFLSNRCFEAIGNARFEDNGKSYLIWPFGAGERYTFGALFLRKAAA
jgi:SAM-dependent methyltransferase